MEVTPPIFEAEISLAHYSRNLVHTITTATKKCQKEICHNCHYSLTVAILLSRHEILDPFVELAAVFQQ